VTLKFNYTMPPFSAIGVGFEWWADEFEKRTDGRYVVETYGFSGLVPDASALDALKNSVCEINMTSTGSQQTSFPLASVTGLPTLTFHKQGVSFDEYLASFDALIELHQEPEITENFKDYKVVKNFEIDPCYLITKEKKVIVPEHLSGLLVGGASGSLADMMEAYGAAGVFQIPPEAYMNMDKGVTTAALMTYAMIGPYKMYEVCDFILKQPFTAGTLLVMMNWGDWNAMSPQDQEIFTETWEEAKIVCAQGMYDENINSEPAIVASGITITVPTEQVSDMWVAACQKYAFPRWAKDCQDLGYSEEVTDRILAKWQELIEKYSTQ
jgi:TRAP-type C4-dicarboxylate transport system substrate-binding protein